MNLTDALEKSFVDEPAHRPVQQRITAGRRLVRRRRAVTGAAAVAVVAVLGAGYAVIGSDGERASEPPIADQKKDQPVEDETSFSQDLLDDYQVVVAPNGLLLKAPGVEILQKVPNPGGYGDPGKAYGVAFTFEGTTRWSLIDPSGGSYEDAFRSFPTFEYWLADQVALQQGEPMLALVRFGAGEELLPRAGVAILQQTGDIDIGPRFAGPNDRSAAAEVRYAGERWYVLARELDGDIQYFPTAASVSKPTLEEFLPYAKDSYNTGDGLR
jgi:hypothetical protein